jgi:hypothetical protein
MEEYNACVSYFTAAESNDGVTISQFPIQPASSVITPPFRLTQTQVLQNKYQPVRNRTLVSNTHTHTHI